MRVVLTLFICVVGLFTSVMPAAAQVGPCGAADACPSGQICIGAVGSRFCFKTCTPPADIFGSATECNASESCATPEGFSRNVCVVTTGASGGPFDPSTIDTRLSCNESRPCAGDTTCVSGTCRQPMGGACTSDADCNVGIRCVGDRISGRTCGVGLPSSSSDSSAEETPEPEFVPITPQLGTPIPGFTPEAPTREGGVVRVAFLAGYINAVYRYLTGIILVVAIVMVVYGGFLYLVGSAGVGSIQNGKRIITDAIMGMIITLAAFAILNTISPATTQLKTLELGYVAGVTLEEAGGVEEFGEAPAGTPSSSCDAPRRSRSDSTYDSLFQRYAGCAGLDWRILKAVAYKESGFRECVTNRWGYTGLFQVRPDTCALRSHGRAEDCNRLVNPEINTAAASVGQLRQGASLINRLCPGLTDAHRYVTLLYFAHNSGGGALQSVVRRVGCNATNEQYDEAATTFWEENSARRGRSLPPNHDTRMSFARGVADTAVGYGVSTPTVPRSACPVT
ncbi:transglycosylase SLT domain-containing protein [Candidatus Uhrbacteria bacterium]|nr:MAG: transglycosylase SLT domain-containing protein [Candidatus Uhrbacteria bacterium]